ncbi:MAG: CCA tRNA nucleotidyltransferase, mitochondrial [Trizodia sp. TS-e1964]|nr:MAG: CCA tRNA nucleotidyltransferase, mitochondrial [Trizodia sp. TS-e1964]
MTTILLTPAETTLQQLLLDVADYIERLPAAEVPQQSLPATPNIHGADKLRLRFTGGWVRDKLLGIPSNDIDVGISSMTGYQFGLRLHEYLSLSGNLEKYNSQVFSPSPGEKPIEGLGSTESKKAELGGLHKIVANPEKSKHLETVTTRILGFDVDLVNLRKETYAADSRNPQMEFGSPEEDALRRDATINALFYNLHTSEIEDFTARGLDDLKAQLIITPLESFQTFMDDPLRVLRLVRFASRLKFNIDPKTQLSMANFQIKQSFREKISRERVGVEVEKMLKGTFAPQPMMAPSG